MAKTTMVVIVKIDKDIPEVTDNKRNNNSIEILQKIYNHGNSEITERYIGISAENKNAYYEEIGNFFDKLSCCKL